MASFTVPGRLKESVHELGHPPVLAASIREMTCCYFGDWRMPTSISNHHGSPKLSTMVKLSFSARSGGEEDAPITPARGIFSVKSAEPLPSRPLLLHRSRLLKRRLSGTGTWMIQTTNSAFLSSDGLSSAEDYAEYTWRGTHSVCAQTGKHRPQCYNCHTTTTPLWRKDDEGKTACGLYYKLHGSARPISMKSDVIRKRSHRRAANGNGSNGDTPSMTYKFEEVSDYHQSSQSELMGALGSDAPAYNSLFNFQFPGPYHPD
ncbi:hypothetical protein CPB85DRAFT_1253899 [Mucidula mucida]|nr:hypothetical protein CPB85DRAFT_1253899 [Mucidula mucida]